MHSYPKNKSIVFTFFFCFYTLKEIRNRRLNTLEIQVEYFFSFIFYPNAKHPTSIPDFRVYIYLLSQPQFTFKSGGCMQKCHRQPTNEFLFYRFAIRIPENPNFRRSSFMDAP